MVLVLPPSQFFRSAAVLDSLSWRSRDPENQIKWRPLPVHRSTVKLPLLDLKIRYLLLLQYLYESDTTSDLLGLTDLAIRYHAKRSMSTFSTRSSNINQSPHKYSYERYHSTSNQPIPFLSLRILFLETPISHLEPFPFGVSDRPLHSQIPLIDRSTFSSSSLLSALCLVVFWS